MHFYTTLTDHQSESLLHTPRFYNRIKGVLACVQDMDVLGASRECQAAAGSELDDPDTPVTRCVP